MMDPLNGGAPLSDEAWVRISGFWRVSDPCAGPDMKTVPAAEICLVVPPAAAWIAVDPVPTAIAGSMTVAPSTATLARPSRRGLLMSLPLLCNQYQPAPLPGGPPDSSERTKGVGDMGPRTTLNCPPMAKLDQ